MIQIHSQLSPTIAQGIWRDAETETMLAQLGADSWSAEQAIRWGFARFHPQVAIVSAFGAEGMVVMDMAARMQPGFRLITIDTEFLFPQTCALIEQVERRYGVRVERVLPSLRPDEQARIYGDALWRRRPDLCCEIRKVEPLRRKLAELHAWFSGIRREQTAARAGARRVEWDSKFRLWKLNPLVDWSWAQVWDYIRAHKVPYNPLHELNYPSIGCTHCTRPVQPGEDMRAGRWSGFGKTECGLHTKE